MVTKGKSTNEIVVELLYLMQQDMGWIKKDIGGIKSEITDVKRDVRAVKEDLYHFKIEVDKRFNEIDEKFVEMKVYVDEANHSLSMDIAEITTLITNNAVSKADFTQVQSTVQKHEKDIFHLKEHTGVV